MPPVPKPASILRRHNAAPSDALLPARGPRSRPRWPFPGPSEAETALWRSLWRRPVANVWATQRVEPSIIARYVRLALVLPLTPAQCAQLTALESALGLTPAAMARLRLKVEEPAPAATVDAAPDNIAAARARYEASR